MSSVPEGIDLKRHRDLPRRGRWAWPKWVLLGLLVVFLLLGLLNLFGQRPSTTSIESSAARLDVSAPSRVRGGLLYQARFTIRARRELRQATVVLSPGWLEGMTVNTIEPSPLGEGSRDGSLVLELGHIPAGDEYVLYVPNLKRERITHGELLEEARLSQIARIEDVRWAVLETNGQISFIEKSRQ